MSEFLEQLSRAGMSPEGASHRAALFEKAMGELRARDSGFRGRRCAFFVPGRIEILGKHTDYAGGRSLLCAVERGVSVVASPSADAQLRVLDAADGSEARLALREEQDTPRGDWRSYAAVVARRMARDFPAARTGAEVVFLSDLPRAAGMSSSSALLVAIFSVLAEINGLSQGENYRQRISSCEDLAGYLAAVESGEKFASFAGDGGVGTLGGSEDHTAVLCSRAGQWRQYSFCPTKLEKEIPMPEQHLFVIGASGAEASKTGNARESYNRCSLAARRILELWRKATGESARSLAAVVGSEGKRERLWRILRESKDAEFPAEKLVERLEQFMAESTEIIPQATQAIERGDLGRLGELVDRSERLAETRLGNQIPETMELARSARALGAVAASAFGGGFGGSVWALVASARAEEFRTAWAASYRQRFPERRETSEFLVSAAGPGRIRCELKSAGEKQG